MRQRAGRGNDFRARRRPKRGLSAGTRSLGALGQGGKREGAKQYRRLLRRRPGGRAKRGTCGQMADAGGRWRRSGAAALYRMAAEQGDGPAQDMLSWMLLEGAAIPRDVVEARRFVLAAAAQGVASSMTRMGMLYHNALGVERDAVE